VPLAPSLLPHQHEPPPCCRCCHRSP
jgi:hypothetical protein